MKAPNYFSRHTTSEWNRAILMQELEQLERERKHLSNKMEERRLNEWELTRYQEIDHELNSLKEPTRAESSQEA